MMEVTFSKQWIHFLRSDLCPPTSTILGEITGHSALDTACPHLQGPRWLQAQDDLKSLAQMAEFAQSLGGLADWSHLSMAQNHIAATQVGQGRTTRPHHVCAWHPVKYRDSESRCLWTLLVE